MSVTDAEAMEAFFELSKTEGIIPALEPSHAIYQAIKLAKELGPGKDVLVNLNFKMSFLLYNNGLYIIVLSSTVAKYIP